MTKVFLVKIVVMIRSIVLLVTISVCVPCYAQKDDRVLREKLAELTRNFGGDVGIYVRHLVDGREVKINADSLFPTASMIKIPITIGVFAMLETGKLDYHQEFIYRDSLLYEGVDLLGSFKDGEKVELGKLLMLMISMSDNTASLWCQHLAGTGSEINKWLANNGFDKTRVNSRTPGREQNRAHLGWGQTTPREMAELLVRIREGKVISKRSSERIYRNLCDIYWDSESLSQIPPYVQVASKQGAVDESRSEVVLVNAPHGDYVFCVITKNQKDTSWTSENEGFVLLRNVSRVLWEYFEPNDQWEPAEGISDWY